ncbi:MAG: ABC transporter permease [Treponema sp.]|nr:ABC transporter permease [Treponema sp.]
MNKSIFFVVQRALFQKKMTTEPARHAKKSWKRRGRPLTFSRITLALTVLFLFLPLIVIIFYSFNEGKSAAFTHLSLRWYRELLFNSRPLWEALLNSVIVAFASATVATILGALSSIGVMWFRFRGRSFIQTITYLPMVLPEVIVGVATLLFFNRMRIATGLFTIFAAHTTFCLPFVFLMVNARLDEFDYSIIEAAHDLGATELQTLFKVIIPSLMPGILSGFLMAVTMSLEDFVITFFVSGPGSTTLPLYVYSMIRFGVSPVINALSFIMIMATCILAFVLRRGLKTFAAH